MNVAQRLEQLGKEVAPGEQLVILASAGTAAAGRRSVRGRAAGQRQLRGRDEAVEVFRLR